MAGKATRRGRLVVLSGPSGSGKSTVVRRALASGDLPVHRSVSATTRSPRPGEVDGRDYHFWTDSRFDEALRQGEFLEWARVHGNRYGTLRSEVEPYRDRGMVVLLEIDVQGAREIYRQYPDALRVFLRTSSIEEHERRLRARNTEDEASIQRRLAAAREELARAGEYDLEVINDSLDEAVQAFRTILRQSSENASSLRGGGERVG